MSSKMRRCMHCALNSVALRSPCQFFTGCGSRQRRSPTGGCANGMPLKMRRSFSLSTTPTSVPFAIFTRAASDEANTGAQNASEVTKSVQRASVLSMKRALVDFIIGMKSETKSIVLCLKGPSEEGSLAAGSEAVAAHVRECRAGVLLCNTSARGVACAAPRSPFPPRREEREALTRRTNSTQNDQLQLDSSRPSTVNLQLLLQ